MESGQNITQQTLGISDFFNCPQQNAVAILQGLDKKTSPIDMLLCLNSVKMSISQAIEEFHSTSDTKECLSADDFLPLFIFVIIQSQLKCVQTFSFYMQNFTFSDTSATELGYILVSFQAAVDYITSDEFPKLEGFSTEIFTRPSKNRYFKELTEFFPAAKTL